MENDFGVLLRSIRKSRMMSQKDLAEKAGIDPSHLNKIEKGINMPSDKVLFNLADVLVAEELFTAAGMLIPPEFEKKHPLKEPIKFPQVEYPQVLEKMHNIYLNEFHKAFHERLEKEDEIGVIIRLISSTRSVYLTYEKGLGQTENENIKIFVETANNLLKLYGQLDELQYKMGEDTRYTEGEAAGKCMALQDIWEEIQRNINFNLSGFLADIIKLDKNDAEFIADIINVRKSKKPPTVE
ncbi:helix-turn-helix protein [Pelotomaculum schinkii]|uniref:Helix-turn-helix protein n=1 Tax=Pelotomaculum schinkii TaxID=78350 RepID=A0A4Y7RB15_9FIRM|nr:helix-turn-helix transcriptional regulator [Pelotomaculum schinkii]TEB06164.1 helix-turn-helix protein [Pelotomaculum schinkii]